MDADTTSDVTTGTPSQCQRLAVTEENPDRLLCWRATCPVASGGLSAYWRAFVLGS
jgi:hypothetical protein